MCAALTSCTGSEYESNAATETSDRECERERNACSLLTISLMWGLRVVVYHLRSGCVAGKRCTCVHGVGEVGFNCRVHGEQTCFTCFPGYGFVAANKSCEKCSGQGGIDPNTPTFNAANDASPCGNHTPCGAGDRFKYLADEGSDTCLACDAGTYQNETQHFHTSCRGACSDC